MSDDSVGAGGYKEFTPKCPTCLSKEVEIQAVSTCLQYWTIISINAEGSMNWGWCTDTIDEDVDTKFWCDTCVTFIEKDKLLLVEQ